MSQDGGLFVSQPPQMPDPHVEVSELIRGYAAYREWIASEKAAFEQRMKSHEAKFKDLEFRILSALSTFGLDSMNVRGVGTVYRYTATSATVSDRDALLRWLEDTREWDVADIRANKRAIREYYDETGRLPPGVTVRSVAKLGWNTSKADMDKIDFERDVESVAT